MKYLFILLSLFTLFSCNNDDDISPEEILAQQEVEINEFLNEYTFFFGDVRRIGDSIRVLDEYITIEGEPFSNSAIKDPRGFYYILNPDNQGTGPVADANDSVLIHLTAKTINEITFESTNANTTATGAPRWYNLDAEISGLQLAFTLINSKEKAPFEDYENQAVFIFPSNLAFGEFGSSVVPSNTVVIYHIEYYGFKSIENEE